MTSSQDDAILIIFGSLLHFCRSLQAEESRKNMSKNTKKTMKIRLKTDEDIEAEDKRQFPN